MDFVLYLFLLLLKRRKIINYTLVVSEITQPPSGSGALAIASDGRSITYTSPNDSFEGQFTFTYTMSDGNGLTDTASVTDDVQNFIPRSFTGNVAFSSTDSVSGVTLQLTGTDVTGASVSETVEVQADGSYSFPNLAPGDYTLTCDPLPFLNDSGAVVQFSSAVNDGDLVQDLVVSGSLRPQYFDIRDFLGSTLQNSLTVAVAGDGTQEWFSPRGDWSQLSTLQVAGSGTSDVVISAVDQTSQNLQATLPIDGARISQVGQESNARLLRIRGSIQSSGLSASSSTTAASGEGEGEASPVAATTSAAGLVAEGEGVAAPPVTPSQPTITAVRQAETSELLPEQAVRHLLGSSMAEASRAGSPEAVDMAMADTLPELQLRLSEGLENSLTTSDDDAIEANDRVFDL